MFKNAFTFEGRIGVKEYRITFILYIISSVIIQYSIESMGRIVVLLFLPIGWILLTQGAKRCHDIGKSGWYQIIPFYGIYLLFAKSDSGINQYGQNPIESDIA